MQKNVERERERERERRGAKEMRRDGYLNATDLFTEERNRYDKANSH